VTVWIDRDRAFVARRYDHLARPITLFEWLLFVPGKFREKAVATLELTPGDRVLPLSVWLMKHTLLGNPYIHPWDHVARATVDFQIRHFLFSAYYVCRGTKRTDTQQSSVLEEAFVRSEAAE